MAYTTDQMLADMDNLRRQRLQGVKRIRLGDRETEFQSGADTAAALAAAQRDVDKALGVKRNRRLVTTTSKDL